MKTYLVTGGAGFIGGCYVRGALKSGEARIVNLDLLTYAGNRGSVPEASEHHLFVHGDICDGRLVAHLLRENSVVAVLNFAAESHVDRSIDVPARFIETNVNGTFQLLNACLEYWRQLDAEAKAEFRLLHVSTDEVYGSLGSSGAFSEDSPYDPSSPYSASKAASDHLVRSWHRTYGLPTLITNCSNNYGPYQFPEKLIPLTILNALEGKPLPVYGDGMNVRDWLFVEDHCDAIRTVLARGKIGETYNVGGNAEQTNLEVVNTICRTIQRLVPDLPHPCEALIQFVQDRPGHDRRYAIDASKIMASLGWQPRTAFEPGIEATVRWYIANQRWVNEVVSGSYRRERLGAGE